MVNFSRENFALVVKFGLGSIGIGFGSIGIHALAWSREMGVGPHLEVG